MQLSSRGEGFLTREFVAPLMAALAARPSEIGPLLEAEPSILAFIREELASRLASCGMTDQQIDATGSLIARTGRKRGRSLLLIMNAMTQAAYDMPDPFVPRIVPGAPYGIPGDVMISRGLSEQKANMAAMLSGIASALKDCPELDGELIVICCPSGETGRHDAIAQAIKTAGVTADMAVLGGTSLSVSLGNRGRIDLTLDVRGRTAHSSRPHQGANAALGACAIVQRLIDLGNHGNRHEHLGSDALTVTGIRSFPETSHTVQDHCVVMLDRRLLPCDDPHDVLQDLRGILASGEPYLDRFSNESLSVSLEMGAYMYPSLVEANAPVVLAIQNAAQRAMGAEIPLVHLTAAFDQGYLNHIGIPAVNFGCGEYAFAHTHDDLASIDRTMQAARIFRQLIVDVAGAPE
jgi:acetylornithine deacetylase/succinyl-diaminopimelate desuccinylase-like protein